MADKSAELLYQSIAMCLEKTFNCDLIRHQCTIALKELDWKGHEIDVVGYNSEARSLYIVEGKNVTWIDSDGIAQAVGEIMIDMAGMREKEALESIRQYAELGDREIKSVYFYIALPNFPAARTEKRISQTVMNMLRTIHKMLSGWVGLLEVYDLNMPARVVEGLESTFIG